MNDSAGQITTLENIISNNIDNYYVLSTNTKLYVLATIIFFTLAGNGLILCLVIGRRKSTITRVYYFMFHLSIADVITAFLTLLPEFIWTLMAPYFYGGNYVCKAVKFVQMIGPYLR
jgi:arginine vasopressin receptor 1A